MRRMILPVALWFGSSAAFVTLDTSVPSLPAVVEKKDSVAASHSGMIPAPLKPVEKVGSVLFLSGKDQRVYSVIGFLKALQDSSLSPDLVVAEGAAAIPAAAYALGYRMEWLDSLFKVHPLESYLGRAQRVAGEESVSPRQDESGELPFQRNLATGKVERKSWSRSRTITSPPGNLALSWLMARILRGAQPESARIPIAFQLVEAGTGNLKLERPGNWQGLVSATATQPDLSRGQPLTRSWPLEPENMVFLEAPFALEPKFPGSGLTVKLVVAEGDLDSTSTWVQMGYLAGIHSVPRLRSVFRPQARQAMAPLRSGNEALLWSNVSFSARGTGYFQLLRQRIRDLSRKGEPETWIPELESQGFYSDLEVEWAEGDGSNAEGGLVLGAKEDPRLLISAGPSLRLMGQSLLRQVPGMMVSLSWAEPHYLPFKAEGAWLAGGNHPGFGGQLLVEPPSPLWTRLSVYNTRQSHRFEAPYSDWKKAGALPISMREDRSGFRLGLGPSRYVNLNAEIRRTKLDNLAVSPDPAIMDDGFTSTDFVLTLRLKCGKDPGPRVRRLEMSQTYVDPVNELGLVRPGFALFRGEFEVGMGPWGLFGQGQYADRVDFEWDYPDWPDAYALWLMPPMRPLSFGMEVMVSRWHHFRYALAGASWDYSWRALAWRLAAGEATYMRLDGFLGAEKRAYFPFWEGGIHLATALGPLRLACGGFGDAGPFVSLHWGARLNLDRLLLDSEL